MKIRLFTIVLIFTASLAFGQHTKRERIRAIKTAFITDELNLTAKEAEKFWPVYNAYETKVHDIKVERYKNIQKKIHESGGIENLSDKEAEKYMNMIIQNDIDLIKAKERLIFDLKKIIPPKKILLLYQSERNFSRKLLEEYRRKRHR